MTILCLSFQKLKPMYIRFSKYMILSSTGFLGYRCRKKFQILREIENIYLLVPTKMLPEIRGQFTTMFIKTIAKHYSQQLIVRFISIQNNNITFDLIIIIKFEGFAFYLTEN